MGVRVCALGLTLTLSTTTLPNRPQTYWLMGLVYEWSHYIVHTRVRPGTKIGRAIKEHHTRYGTDTGGVRVDGDVLPRSTDRVCMPPTNRPFQIPSAGTTWRTTASGSPSAGRQSTRSSTRYPHRHRLLVGAAKAGHESERARQPSQ